MAFGTTDLDQVLRKKLAAKVAKEIDLNKLAKQIAPAVEQALRVSITNSAKKLNMTDLLYDVLDKSAYKEFEQVFIRALKKLK